MEKAHVGATFRSPAIAERVAMSTTDPEDISQFESFRLKLSEWATRRFEQDNPDYVQHFKRRLSETRGDLNLVLAETRPMLRGPRRWRKLLSTLLDVEQTMDKVRRSVWFIGSSPAPSRSRISDPGAWLIYHVDSWYLHTYGLLDRMQKMITLTCRHVVQPRSRGEKIKAALIADVKKMKGVIKDTRDAVAHGGGSVEALEEQDLWEPYVVIGPESWLNITSSFYENVAGRRKRWHSFIERSAVQVFATCEAWFAKLNKEAFSDDAGS